MKCATCPICNKRFTESFLLLHAASCGEPIQKTISKATVRPHQKLKLKQKQNVKATSAQNAIPNSNLPSESAQTLSQRRGISPPICPVFRMRPKYRTSISVNGPASECGAPGFHLFPGLFNDVESALIGEIEKAPPLWRDHRFRLAKNYGPAYNLSKRRFLFGQEAPKEIPLPSYATNLVLPVLRRNIPMIADFKPNQLAVAMYKAEGGHILPHNDCENGDIKTGVIGVCLGARCTMTLILRSRMSAIGKDVKKDIVLPRGAVYLMTGDALRVWEHAIFPKKTEGTRYSLTFRDVSARSDELPLAR